MHQIILPQIKMIFIDFSIIKSKIILNRFNLWQKKYLFKKAIFIMYKNKKSYAERSFNLV